MRKKINIKYHDGVEQVIKAGGKKSDWIDMRVAEDVFIEEGTYMEISLGVSMELPRGYEAHVLPRSSTFKKYGIIMTNSEGIIDNTYCGDNDIWHFPAWCLRGNTIYNGKKGTFIHKNDRICQFRIEKKQPRIKFIEFLALHNPNRGGFGSTGVD